MGSIALVSASLLATTAAVLGRFRPRFERPLQIAAIGLVGLAAVHVAWLLTTEDTSYLIVVDHTRPGLSVVRRIMGLWGGSAGSLLLFAFIVGGVLVVAPIVDRFRLAASVVIATLGWTLVFAASPFERLENPAIAGSGLSPILEHWAMIIHPPLLYLGLALSLVPALVDPRRGRRWAGAAIAALTTALALGGGWAYVELGWGGWYAWDPVENAALIPWLLLVAAVHARPSHAVFRWATLLIWPTVFAGTAMTRTSLRTSVHSFANSDGLGWTLWPLAVAVSVGALAVGVAGRSRSSSGSLGRRLMPVGLLAFAAVVVALGTFRPFIPGEATSGTFYSRFLFPIAIAGLVGLGVAPRRATPASRLAVEGFVGAAITVGAGAALGWSHWWQLTFAAAIGAAIATTVAGDARPTPRLLAHLGMICVMAGTLGTTASLTQTFPLEAGESIVIDGHTVTNRSIDVGEGPPPVITATITVEATELQPSLAVYPERGLRLPEVATRRRVHEDVQLILRSADDDGSVLLTMNIQPLTQLVWLGAALIALAAIRFAFRGGPSATRSRSTLMPASQPEEAAVQGSPQTAPPDPLG